MDLLLEDVLERIGIGGKLADTLAEFVHSHGGLVEVESEERLIFEVALLLDIKRRRIGCVELLGNLVFAVVKLLEKVWLVIRLAYEVFDRDIKCHLLQWSGNRNQRAR